MYKWHLTVFYWKYCNFHLVLFTLCKLHTSLPLFICGGITAKQCRHSHGTLYFMVLLYIIIFFVFVLLFCIFRCCSLCSVMGCSLAFILHSTSFSLFSTSARRRFYPEVFLTLINSNIFFFPAHVSTPCLLTFILKLPP